MPTIESYIAENQDRFLDELKDFSGSPASALYLNTPTIWFAAPNLPLTISDP